MLNQMMRPHIARKRGQDHQDTSCVSVEAILEVNPQCLAIPADTMWIRDACPAKSTPFLSLEIKEKMNTCFKALSEREKSETFRICLFGIKIIFELRIFEKEQSRSSENKTEVKFLRESYIYKGNFHL